MTVTELVKIIDLEEVWKDKDKWYRIEEREKVATPIRKVPYGSWISANRIVIRAGYFNSPMDMPIEELREQIYQEIRQDAGWRMIQARDGNLEPDNWQIGQLAIPKSKLAESLSEISYAQVKSILAELGSEPERIARDYAYSIRKRWLAKQPKNDLRTLWYIDWPDFTSQMQGIVMKKIGRPWHDWDEFGGNTSGFEEIGHQQLYKFHDYWHDLSDMVYYVHPLDVLDGAL